MCSWGIFPPEVTSQNTVPGRYLKERYTHTQARETGVSLHEIAMGRPGTGPKAPNPMKNRLKRSGRNLTRQYLWHKMAKCPSGSEMKRLPIAIRSPDRKSQVYACHPGIGRFVGNMADEEKWPPIIPAAHNVVTFKHTVGHVTIFGVFPVADR